MTFAAALVLPLYVCAQVPLTAALGEQQEPTEGATPEETAEAATPEAATPEAATPETTANTDEPTSGDATVLTVPTDESGGVTEADSKPLRLVRRKLAACICNGLRNGADAPSAPRLWYRIDEGGRVVDADFLGDLGGSTTASCARNALVELGELFPRGPSRSIEVTLRTTCDGDATVDVESAKALARPASATAAELDVAPVKDTPVEKAVTPLRVLAATAGGIGAGAGVVGGIIGGFVVGNGLVVPLGLTVIRQDGRRGVTFLGDLLLLGASVVGGGTGAALGTAISLVWFIDGDDLGKAMAAAAVAVPGGALVGSATGALIGTVVGFFAIFAADSSSLFLIALPIAGMIFGGIIGAPVGAVAGPIVTGAYSGWQLHESE